MHRHEIAVLGALKKSKKITLQGLIDETCLGRDEAMWAIQNLTASGLIEVRKESVDEVALTKEGAEYSVKGLPEHALIKRLCSGAIQIGKLSGKEDQIGFMWAKKKGLVTIDKGLVKLTEKGNEAAEKGMPEENILREICTGKAAYEKNKNLEAVFEFKKRGLIEIKSKEEVKEVVITPAGLRQANAEAKPDTGVIENVDKAVIKNKSWAGKNFKEYNVRAPVEPQEAAVRHPLRMLINEIRDAYTSLGFKEVSGPVIDSSFWVYDYLFMPQHHPARDMQDTFFLSRPNKIQIQDRKLVKRMKEEHEKAWHETWSEEIAMQAVPRSHMTSVTARHMNQIIKDVVENPDKYELPVKIFSIGRVFRNENIDFKHLADFYQMDGMIIGRNLTLANLFDVLLKLYGKLGVNLKFKPSFFPFVEPGVEAYTELSDGRAVELFGAGMIRREITGVKRKSITVLAWGPGVERIMLFKNMGIDSISSMFNTSAGWLRNTVMR